MADVVMKIIDVGIAIKEAINTARSNHKECKAIAKVADHVCGLMRMLHASAEPMLRLVVAGALGSVLDSMKEALELVISCGKKNIVLQLITAQSTAKKLTRVQSEILQKISLGTLAVTVATAVNLSRPQLSVQLPQPVHCGSRIELGLMLEAIYNGQSTVQALWALVTPETTTTVAFASKAAGAQATYLTGPDNNVLCAIAIGYRLNNPIFHDIVYPHGVSVFSCFAICGRYGVEQLCAHLLDYRSLMPLLESNPSRPQISEITDDSDAATDLPESNSSRPQISEITDDSDAATDSSKAWLAAP